MVLVLLLRHLKDLPLWQLVERGPSTTVKVLSYRCELQYLICRVNHLSYILTQ